MANYLMVRAMRQTPTDFEVFFSKHVVAVGWSEVNFSAFADPDALIGNVHEIYYSDGSTMPQVVGKKQNEVRRFKAIQRGDFILVPYWDAIRLATAIGQQLYDESNIQNDLANQHGVEYLTDAEGKLLTIARDQLSEGLQRRLRVRGSTVSDLTDFGKEIDDLFRGHSFVSSINSHQENMIKEFKSSLLIIIRNGTSGLKAGGLGLEILVNELLEIDGYEAHIQSKQRFPGFADADIEASRYDRFSPTKLLVQVKHHNGQTDAWGAQQLLGIVENERDLFAEHKLVLVTSGDASSALRDLCEKNNISLFSGRELVDWISDSRDALKPHTKRMLRISDIPQIVAMR